MQRRSALSEENETKDLLKKMALFSISTNQLSEIHQKNLKMYPFVFFNGVKSVEIDYDITNHSSVDYDTNPKTMEIVYKFNKPNTDHFKIKYYLSIDESEVNDHMEKRFEALERAIATLLWNEIPLEVFFNNKSVYVSKNVRR